MVSDPSTRLSATTPSVFFATYFAVLGVVLPFLGPTLVAWGFGPVAVGFITAAFPLAKFVYAPFLGAWVDRGHWFPGILAVHVVLAGVCAASLPWAGGAVLVGVLVFLIGLGHGTVLPLVEAVVLERLPDIGYGRLRLWGSIGFVVVAVGWPAVLGDADPDIFPWALVASLLLLGFACLPFEGIARPPVPESAHPIPGRVWALIGVLFLHQVAHGPFYAFLSIHLQASGFAADSVGLLWSVAVVAEMAAFILSRRLELRFGHRKLLGFALAITPLRWVLLALPLSPAIVVLAQMGHAATFALTHLAGIQLVQRHVPPNARRHAQALYSGLTFGLGMVVGSALAGPVYGSAGGSTAFLAAAGVSGVVFTLWLSLSRRLADVG